MLVPEFCWVALFIIAMSAVALVDVVKLKIVTTAFEYVISATLQRC